MNKSYTLASHGDGPEQHYYQLFLNTSFSNYENFWQQFIIPLTNRPKNIHFKNNRELKQIGCGDKEVCISQLHYTVFKHLARVYEIKQLNPLDLDQFADGLARLSSALDVADELLERFTTTVYYDPWLETDGKKARESWRKKHRQMQWLRNYRNKLLHGRIPPSIAIIGSYIRYRVPKFGQENKYLDWRKVTNASVGSGGIVRNDFDAPNNLINFAWEEVTKYLQNYWGKYLLLNTQNQH